MRASKQQKLEKKFKHKYKVGLCLSGGGTRGFSYIGAFKAFEDYGIKFDMISGTSAGSLFGSLYACGFCYEDMYKLTYDIKNKDFKRSKLIFLPSKLDNLQELIKNILPVKKIEDLKIPYFAVAVDLKTGKEVQFKDGNLAKIITGSCAIPGVFLPVKYKNMTLVDGGVLNNVPADVLRQAGCDFVITIDCNSVRGAGTASEKMLQQFSASIGIMTAYNSQKGINLSDIVICPNLTAFNSLKINGKNDMIKEGYRATVEIMPEIQKLFMGKLRKKKWSQNKRNLK